ncbi:Hsp70 family protein, partial [Mycobacterium sp.]|uniref:Hsp70 family protein n=1 Tax=Mycobacterium sp. TaxID=1785 RepID=UPI0025F90BEC
MAEGARPALGLSIGATNLAAATADVAIIRKPVLTLFRQRPPEVGLPSENPRPDEPGVVITDFVDRVGNPVGIVAPDGSVHRSDALAADALRALAYVATGGRALPENAAVTFPAHWSTSAVDTLGAALARVPEWSNRGRPVLLISDAAATLAAVRINPGIPTRGTVAVVDFGGSGTSITLMNAAGGYQAIAPTVRHHDFSGNMIDQAFLTAVMASMPSTGFDPVHALPIGSLSRLRAGCRSAKEQLSSSTLSLLTDDLTSTRGDTRLTRDDLEEAIRESLDNFVAVLDDTLRRNGIHDLAAVISIGGGANIPMVTATLSGHLRVPVITTPRPQVTAAVGAALRAARVTGDDAATTLAGPASATATAPAARAWPQPRRTATATIEAAALNDMPNKMRAVTLPKAADGVWTAPAPAPEQAQPAEAAEPAEPAPPADPEPKKRRRRWYRLPAVAIVSAALILLLGTALAIELRSDDTTTAPAHSTNAAAPADPSPQPQAPAPSATPADPPTAETPTAAPPPAPESPQAPSPPIPRSPAAH